MTSLFSLPHMFMTSLFSLRHMFFTATHVHDFTAAHVFYYCMCSWLMSSSCLSSTRVLSSCMSSSCLSARKKFNCPNNWWSRFEQFCFLCRAVDFFKKVLSNHMSSYHNSSSWYAPNSSLRKLDLMLRSCFNCEKTLSVILPKSKLIHLLKDDETARIKEGLRIWYLFNNQIYLRKNHSLGLNLSRSVVRKNNWYGPKLFERRPLTVPDVRRCCHVARRQWNHLWIWRRRSQKRGSLNHVQQ
jgi:hypothetical protein